MERIYRSRDCDHPLEPCAVQETYHGLNLAFVPVLAHEAVHNILAFQHEHQVRNPCPVIRNGLVVVDEIVHLSDQVSEGERVVRKMLAGNEPLESKHLFEDERICEVSREIDLQRT